MSEDQTRAALIGQTVTDVIYVLDHGDETMYLIFPEFALELHPIITTPATESGSASLHLAHRKVALADVRHST